MPTTMADEEATRQAYLEEQQPIELHLQDPSKNPLPAEHIGKTREQLKERLKRIKPFLDSEKHQRQKERRAARNRKWRQNQHQRTLAAMTTRNNNSNLNNNNGEEGEEPRALSTMNPSFPLANRQPSFNAGELFRALPPGAATAFAQGFGFAAAGGQNFIAHVGTINQGGGQGDGEAAPEWFRRVQQEDERRRNEEERARQEENRRRDEENRRLAEEAEQRRAAEAEHARQVREQEENRRRAEEERARQEARAEEERRQQLNELFQTVSRVDINTQATRNDQQAVLNNTETIMRHTTPARPRTATGAGTANGHGMDPNDLFRDSKPGATPQRKPLPPRRAQTLQQVAFQAGPEVWTLVDQLDAQNGDQAVRFLQELKNEIDGDATLYHVLVRALSCVTFDSLYESFAETNFAVIVVTDDTGGPPIFLYGSYALHNYPDWNSFMDTAELRTVTIDDKNAERPFEVAYSMDSKHLVADITQVISGCEAFQKKLCIEGHDHELPAPVPFSLAPGMAYEVVQLSKTQITPQQGQELLQGALQIDFIRSAVQDGEAFINGILALHQFVRTKTITMRDSWMPFRDGSLKHLLRAVVSDSGVCTGWNVVIYPAALDKIPEEEMEELQTHIADQLRRGNATAMRTTLFLQVDEESNDDEKNPYNDLHVVSNFLVGAMNALREKSATSDDQYDDILKKMHPDTNLFPIGFNYKTVESEEAGEMIDKLKNMIRNKLGVKLEEEFEEYVPTGETKKPDDEVLCPCCRTPGYDNQFCRQCSYRSPEEEAKVLALRQRLAGSGTSSQFTFSARTAASNGDGSSQMNATGTVPSSQFTFQALTAPGDGDGSGQTNAVETVPPFRFTFQAPTVASTGDGNGTQHGFVFAAPPPTAPEPTNPPVPAPTEPAPCHAMPPTESGSAPSKGGSTVKTAAPSSQLTFQAPMAAAGPSGGNADRAQSGFVFGSASTQNAFPSMAHASTDPKDGAGSGLVPDAPYNAQADTMEIDVENTHTSAMDQKDTATLDENPSAVDADLVPDASHGSDTENIQANAAVDEMAPARRIRVNQNYRGKHKEIAGLEGRLVKKIKEGTFTVKIGETCYNLKTSSFTFLD